MAATGDPTVVHAATRILVVEHEHAAAEELCGQLGSLGYHVCGRTDTGAAAIDATAALRPDVVVINALLPGEISGIRAAAEIGGSLETPLLFLSANNDPDTVELALRAHPYAYLSKPFELHELYAQIEVSLAKGRSDKQLRDALQWYAATLRGVADSVVVTDAASRVRFLNPAAETLVGWRLTEAQGQDIDRVLQLQDADRNPLPSPLRQVLSAAPRPAMPQGLRLVPRGGESHVVEDSVAPIYSNQGKLLGAVMVLRDIQQRAAAEQRLRQSEERFRNAFDLAPGGMALAAADGRFVQVNAAMCRLLRVAPDNLTGRKLDDYAADEAGAAPHLELLHGGHGATVQFEQRLRAGGLEVWALVSVSLLRPDDGGGMLFQLHDITERKLAEARLARLAHFDALTGLPNRAAISEEIERQIALARRHGHRLAVVFLDLDYFKHVNDSLGHEAGDELLRVIGRRLRAAVRVSDMVGRLGGDEFVLLLPEIADLEDVMKVAAKMQAECLKPIHMLGHELRVGISLGASLFPDDAQDSRSLLRYADSAMYAAKAEGRHNLQFYRRDMTRGMEQRLRLGAHLRHALERQEFELYFQPIVALDSSRPRAAEALLRWNHPDLGLLGPDQFLPLAEDIGLGAALNAWVFQAACRAAAVWPATAPEPLRLSINVSPSQFRDHKLMQLIRQSLSASGLPPERLCVEITEHLMLGDNPHNRDICHQLKALGVQISIDDFGTGYSSLSYLSHFNPDELKIDRSLIRPLCDEAEHAAIVRAAIAMAHGLQLTVVTEGVENAQQHALLRAMGCDYGQGYWYLRPCPAAQFDAWLAGTMAARSGPTP
ncbi:GGDEF/EAL domain-containing response regulator [Duganella sp. LjRoot269]|jgi:diguanylate cyclase (GGDEF)-like protein/PAS domain S-box-containing protein|uniref:GGDEF/EAL domain-containing response regulator n=1 Tax=Duganella sp. LjRoot269 TaxID=3342305 RepID=UPI003ECC75A9